LFNIVNQSVLPSESRAAHGSDDDVQSSVADVPRFLPEIAWTVPEQVGDGSDAEVIQRVGRSRRQFGEIINGRVEPWPASALGSVSVHKGFRFKLCAEWDLVDLVDLIHHYPYYFYLFTLFTLSFIFFAKGA
jgi:hypothetical protein